MAIYSQSDLVTRFKSLLPVGWFADSSPILDGILSGMARIWENLLETLRYVRQQTRISTATDSFLDGISADFFGSCLGRRLAEPDAAFRRRILLELIRLRNTRQSLCTALIDLTGRPPVIFEPARPADAGSYGAGAGYNVAGGWGSLALPFQCFVTAYRSTETGIPVVAGYCQGGGGYGIGALEYASLSMVGGQITDADICSTVAHVMPASTVAWLRISN